MGVETLELDSLVQPRFEDCHRARTDYRQYVELFGTVLDLRIFHDEEVLECLHELWKSGPLQRQPKRIFVGEDVHLRNNLSLRGKMCGIASRARNELLHIIGNHALKP